jgi:hypothetical protein
MEHKDAMGRTFNTEAQRHRNNGGRIEQRCPLRGFKGASPLFGVRYGPKSKCRLRFCRTAFTQIHITTSERTNVHFPQLCEKAVRQNRSLQLLVGPYRTPKRGQAPLNPQARQEMLI